METIPENETQTTPPPVERLAYSIQEAADMLDGGRELENQGKGKHEDIPGLKPKGRLTEMVELLKANGPMTRKQIIESSKLPLGTISYNLNQGKKKHIIEMKDDKWQLIN